MTNMNFGLSEMIFIFLLALLLFGPKKMPEIGRQIGRALNEFRRASNEFKSQIESEIQNLERESNAGEILPPAKPVAGAISTSTPADVIADPEVVASTEAPPPQHAAAKAPDA
jgi:sec-independent protein translocase protein TatB